MLKRVFFGLSFFFLVMQSALAISHINVSVINKKGMNYHFELVDELHSVELFEPEKPLRLKMNNGLEVVLRLKLEKATDKNKKSFFYMEGDVFRSNGTKISSLAADPIRLYYDTPQRFDIKDGDKQLVEVTVRAIEVTSKK